MSSTSRSSTHGDSAALILLTTVFFPPLAIFLLKGCTAEVIIGVCLTILGWIPGVIYAIFLWMQAGGFQESYKAEERIEKVKAKYRERKKLATNAKNSPETITGQSAHESSTDNVENVLSEQNETLTSEHQTDQTLVTSAADQSQTLAVDDPVENLGESTQMQNVMPQSSDPVVLPQVNAELEAGTETATESINESRLLAPDTEIPVAVRSALPKEGARKKKGKAGTATSGGFYSGLFSARSNRAREIAPETSGTAVAATPSEVRVALSREGSAPGTPGPGQMAAPAVTK